jgi:hemerythrin HHE cation binding domain-containing protein
MRERDLDASVRTRADVLDGVEVEHRPDRGRIPRAVRPEKPERLARVDGQVEVDDAACTSIGLRQPLHLDDVRDVADRLWIELRVSRITTRIRTDAPPIPRSEAQCAKGGLMATVTARTLPLVRENEQLLDHVEHIRVAALELPALWPEERHELLGRILDFLRHDLGAHAEREESGLYPHVARILGDPRATDSMTYDHVAIRQLTARLADASVHDVSLLQELLYGLHALITVHFQKEEEVYLPLLDQDR